ncbi:MAG: M20 family metallopeptidase [Anaerolineae bacterium]|nr:M20 family metallopeptidase [Anaerolineae bacterium]NUQ07017.1 M20 family metallopeptidase [Anaerolineae bacterium]
MSELLQYFQSRQDAMVEMLTALVNHESGTKDKDKVDKLTDFMQAQFTELGASSVTRIAQSEVGDMLFARWNETAPGKPIMFLIHIDTVWGLGTLAERPVRIDADGRLFGPGAIDMKGGITIVLESIRGLRALNQFPNRPIWVLMTTDEEVGSTYSTPYIKEYSAQAGLVLVMEPATIDEALKTWRKGIATYKMEIEGLPSHAGNAPEKGVNAIIEFAQQALRAREMNDLKNGTSVSVTMVEGGSATNVIPAHVTAYIDTRVLTVRAADEIEAAMTDATPFVPGAKVRISRINGHKPMERNPLMQRTYAQCKAVGERYGLTIREDGSGGASDGNTVATLGVPVLDGLGPQGDGLHALHEHVVIASLPRRCTLIAGMLKDWVMEEA